MTEPYHSPDSPGPPGRVPLALILAGFAVLALVVALIVLAVVL